MRLSSSWGFEGLLYQGQTVISDYLRKSKSIGELEMVLHDENKTVIIGMNSSYKLTKIWIRPGSIQRYGVDKISLLINEILKSLCSSIKYETQRIVIGG